MSRLAHGIIQNDRELMFTEYFSMLESGVPPEQIITEMIVFFRNILIIKSNIAHNRFVGFNPNLYDKKMTEAFSFEDIENIMEILFKTYENSKTSIDIQTETEMCLLKLLKYKELIRPKQIISQLNLLKNAMLSGDELKAVPESTDILKETTAKQEVKNNLPSSSSSSESKKTSAEKSDLLKIIKSKLSSSHFQLSTALNNISYIEEKDNQMLIYFSHKMHHDIAKKHEDLLTQEAIAIIGEKYNNNFKIKVKFKKEEKNESVGEINKTKIKNIFHGQEI